MPWRRRVLVATLLLLSQSCVDNGHADKTDRILSYDLLMRPATLEQSVPLSEFTPGRYVAEASNHFSGRLTLGADTRLPVFDFEFVQDGRLLVPLRPGPIVNDHELWEFVLLAGSVWNEETDKGLSRAVIPFALKERAQDCIHNGLLTFLFENAGDVSKVAFQISNQTCPYMQFESYGLLTATYEPGAVSGGEAAVAAEKANRAGRLPQRAIAALATDFPGTSPAAFGSTQEIDPQDMTLFGFVVDGTHYVGGCSTPYGRYPYCDELALPSYSTAKSLVGGLGLMLLEEQYPGTASALIRDYVPECDASWDGVTIEHAIDQTTGHYNSPDSHADENAAIGGRFFTAADHATKIDYACNESPRRSPGGKTWVYQTWASYLAGTALNNRLKSIEGPQADFYDDYIVEKLWEPLGLSRVAMQTRRTYDSSAQPFTGFGLTLLRDDVARLADFLGASNGHLNDEELLDRSLFDAIKLQGTGDPGMQAETEAIRYNNGFRTFDVTKSLGCENRTVLTTMSGFGGINIVLMPNDTAYYYFSDGNVHRYLHAVHESHKIRSMCQ